VAEVSEPPVPHFKAGFSRHLDVWQVLVWAFRPFHLGKTFMFVICAVSGRGDFNIYDVHCSTLLLFADKFTIVVIDVTEQQLEGDFSSTIYGQEIAM